MVVKRNGKPMVCVDCGKGGGTLVNTPRGYVHAVKGTLPRARKATPVGVVAKALGMWLPGEQNAIQRPR